MGVVWGRARNSIVFSLKAYFCLNLWPLRVIKLGLLADWGKLALDLRIIREKRDWGVEGWGWRGQPRSLVGK